MARLFIEEKIPDAFFDISPRDLHTIFQGPTLIEIPGEKSEAVFISILLHGNETTGFFAVRELLKSYLDKKIPLKHTLVLFFGNIFAAREGVRVLPNQMDYNRIWRGGDQLEHAMAMEVLAELKKRELFLAVDIHNNSGKNPYYGCVNSLKKEFLYFASLFQEIVVYFTKPDNVLSKALSEMCPSVVLECGQPAEPKGIQSVKRYLEHCIQLDRLPVDLAFPEEIKLYESIGRILVPHEASFDFSTSPSQADFTFFPNIEDHNFKEIPIKTQLGWANAKSNFQIVVLDAEGNEIQEEYFAYTNSEIRVIKPFVPSMFTKDVDIIHRDCLGYIIKRIHSCPK